MSETHNNKSASGMEASLRAAGLDVEYIRGEGDFLYYEDADAQTVQVLDMVGGYGASLFGHNNPRLVNVLQTLLH